MIAAQTPTARWGQLVSEQVCGVLAGQEETVRWCLAAILAGGHILLEDIPGVGKTTLALALSDALGLSFGRVQFTPDVMATDVVGYSVPKEGEMCYKPGAVMCNLLLADEINRAPSRTQAALLEAMEEGQVTVDGVCRRLPKPFVLIATQNPLGAAGTQPLPDSQLDRFAVRLRLGYPGSEAEKDLVLGYFGKKVPKQVSSAEELLKLQAVVASTYICDAVADYIVGLTAATRKAFRILRGASPRATLSLAAVAKAWAQLEGRDFVIPEDVQLAFLRCVPHRVLAAGDAGARLRKIMGRIRLPKLC